MDNVSSNNLHDALPVNFISMKKKHILVDILPRFIWLVQGFVLALGERLSGHTPILSKNPIVLVIGITLTVLGAILLIWTGKHLVRAMSSRELIQTGPYKYIRHPMYVFIYLILIGVGMLWFSSTWFLILLVFIPVWYIIGKVEERHLERSSGDNYQAYKMSTGMFIPKLRRNVNKPR